MKKLIGTGTFANVYLECSGHEKLLAVKKSKIECSAWPLLPKHPNLLCLLKKETRKSKFIYYSKYYKNGDLFGLTQRCGRLPEDIAIHMLLHITAGLQVMHRAGFAHRDIKLENILLNDEYMPVICDFDFAVKIINDNPNHVHKRCGSIPYCAPEVLIVQKHDPKKADCWSLGIVLFALITGRLPFDSTIMPNDDTSIANRIKNNEYNIPLSIGSPIAGIITSLLDPNPELRPSVDKLRDQLKALHTKNVLDTTLKYRIDRLLEPVGHAISPPPPTMYLHSNQSGGIMFPSDLIMEGYKPLPTSSSRQ